MPRTTPDPSSVDAPVVVVLLRRPNDKDDARHDPFYEFGSFGVTGCHTKLVSAVEDGTRLAIVQGGRDELRLVMLTPPIRGKWAGTRKHLAWNRRAVPLSFGSAPTIVDNEGRSKVFTPAQIRGLIGEVNRETPVARFASKFRSRHKPLDPKLARRLATIWDAACTQEGGLASSYAATIPSVGKILTKAQRRECFRVFEQKARGEPVDAPRDCRPREGKRRAARPSVPKSC